MWILCTWQMLHSKLSMKATGINSAVLYDGSILDFDSRLHGFDIGTCLEVSYILIPSSLKSFFIKFSSEECRHKWIRGLAFHCYLVIIHLSILYIYRRFNVVRMSRFDGMSYMNGVYLLCCV